MKHLKKILATIGYARLLIIVFLVAVFIVAGRMEGLSVQELASSSLTRIGMWGILVLALVPAVQCGAGLNFGLPIGIVCGLVGALMSIEYGLNGLSGVAGAALFAIPFALSTGLLFALLLRRVRGHEMMVGTYAGFSIVSIMSIFWVVAPFKSSKLILPMAGKGVRPTIDITGLYAGAIDRIGSFKLAGVLFPTGVLAAFIATAALLWLWGRTRAGSSMRWSGTNPRFALSCGVRVDRMYILGIVLSTILAAIGTVMYCQSFGRIQLYTAPLFMAFPAVAALLLGGATTQRATVAHAVIGVILFQTLLTIALPVASELLQGDVNEVTEVVRLIVSNAIILYALTRRERVST
ncbi:MAG: ABC transporter permease [Planctomycetota bacterium]|nr:ABC transporter permease [Planctomycetota bacterium]